MISVKSQFLEGMEGVSAAVAEGTADDGTPPPTPVS